MLHDAGCFHNRLSDTTSRARTNCSACLLPRYYPRLTRCVASLLPLSQRAACELSGVGVTARQLEPRCAARARRRPRVHVPHAARTEERTRNVSRTDPASVAREKGRGLGGTAWRIRSEFTARAAHRSRPTRWSGSSAEGAVPPSLQMHPPQLTQHAKAAASKTTTTRRGPHISSSSGLSATPKHSAAMVMR